MITRAAMFSLLVLCSACYAGEFSGRVLAGNRERSNIERPLLAMSAAERRTWMNADIKAAKALLAEFERNGELGKCDEADLVAMAELYEKCYRFEKVSEISTLAISRFPKCKEAMKLKFRAMLNLRQVREADEFVTSIEKDLPGTEEPIPNAHSFLSMRYSVSGDWANVARHCDKSLVHGLGQVQDNPIRLRQCVADIRLLCRAPRLESELTSECQLVLDKHFRLLHEQVDLVTSVADVEKSVPVEHALFEVWFELAAQSRHPGASDVAAWWLERMNERWTEKFSALVLASVTSVNKRSGNLRKDAVRLQAAITTLQETAKVRAKDGDETSLRVGDEVAVLRRRLGW